jgi:hypothetical protein
VCRLQSGTTEAWRGFLKSSACLPDWLLQFAPPAADFRRYNLLLLFLSIHEFSMISSRIVATALRAQAPALQAVKTRPAARIFQQTRGFKNSTKLREPIPVRPPAQTRALSIQC